MKLHRPYIPLTVRYQVARELLLKRQMVATAQTLDNLATAKARLHHALYHLFGSERVHLDHDPPLMQRTKRRGKYVPDANDPKHLIWRTAAAHRIKTFVRGDGARRSDMSERRYRKRVAKRKKRKRKFKPRRVKHIRRSHAAI